MNVYMVSRGEYSDYTVLAIFSTKEKAEAYLGDQDYIYLKKDEDYSASELRIEERTLDDTGGESYKPVVRLEIGIKEGNILSMRTDHERVKDNQNPLLHVNPRLWDDRANGGSLAIAAIGSENLAIKLAIEARQKYLREMDVFNKEYKP